jgi:hypothetical protein
MEYADRSKKSDPALSVSYFKMLQSNPHDKKKSSSQISHRQGVDLNLWPQRPSLPYGYDDVHLVQYETYQDGVPYLELPEVRA